jgi:hypothetical protein
MGDQWRKPPVWAVAAGVLLLALGATAGGSLVFQDQFYAFAKPIVRARSQVHNLIGIAAIDEVKITETVEPGRTGLSSQGPIPTNVSYAAAEAARPRAW